MTVWVEEVGVCGGEWEAQRSEKEKIAGVS